MRMPFINLAAMAALLLVVLPLAATEWDATFAGDSAMDFNAPARHFSGAPINSETLWVSDNRFGLTRFSNTGEVLKRVPGSGANGGYLILRNLAEGGALTFANFSIVSRINAQGTTLWWFDLSSIRNGISSSLLQHLETDATGAIWLLDAESQRVYKIGPDGHLSVSLSAGDLNMTRIEAIGAAQSGEMALVVGSIGDDSLRLASARLSARGEVLSTWIGPTVVSGPEGFFAATVVDADRALALARDATGQLIFARHDARGGTTVLSTGVELVGAVSATQATSTGVILLTSTFSPSSNGRSTFHFLTADGVHQYSHDISNESQQWVNARCSFMEAADGAFWAMSAPFEAFGITGVPRPLRISAAGVTPIAFDSNASPLLLAIAPTSSSALIADGHVHMTVNTAGQVNSMGTALSSDVLPMFRAMATTAADGNSYVVQRSNRTDASPENATISRVARDGNVVWSAPVTHVRFPAPYPRFNSTQIAANGARVCFYIQESNYLYCHSAATGAFQSRIELPLPAYDSVELSSDDHVILRRRLGGAIPALVLDASNGVLPASTFTPAMLAPRLYSNAGYELHFDSSSTTSISSIHRESRATPATTPALTWQLGSVHVPAVLPDGQPAVLILDDGSALLLAYGESAQSPLLLQRLNADGSLGYRRTFDMVTQQANLYRVGNRVLITTYRNPGYLQMGESRLLGLSLTDGSTEWQHLVTEPTRFNNTNTSSELIMEADGLHGIWWTTDALDINARRIRISDGAEVARSDLPCTLSPCTIERAQADAHGTTVLPLLSRRERSPFAAMARADQEVLEGAWYQPQTSGQGVLFDYLPERRTWFGTWHSSDLSGINSRAGLRWFTLQGQANTDGTQADLGIYLASGGNFDSGPRISSTRIGDATLRFDSCGSANLDYRITSGELQGSVGSIPLRLLTPHSGSCATLGQTPVTAPISERNGISSRYSGTWYQPETSGQGIEASIRPELGNGTIIAGWFTFDPQAAADDAQAQHWFTLQGDLSSAASGSVTMPIYRTIGGAFDRSGSRNTVRVGEATWRFVNCEQSQLTYRFDDSDVAGAFGGRVGSMTLQRIGDCAAP